jgi:probable F420-dependent oxidoreductase
MRFGLALPHYDTSFAGAPVTWEGVAEVAARAEAAGFDSLWISDHLFLDWGKYGGPTTRQGSLEAWTTLSALAGATDRIRLGTLTLCNDLRNPALLAKMAATLDLLSKGRLELGLGAGWYEPEYAAAGIDFDEAGTRIARLGEAASIVARLLEGEELTHHGRNYELDGAICRPGPLQEPRPPIWIGGKGDYLLKIVARHADGWNFSWIGDLSTYKDRLSACERICESEGRDRPLRRSVGAYVLAGKDDADVLRRYERLLHVSPVGVLPAPSEQAAVSFESFKASRVAGTVGEVTDRFGELAALGVEEVIVTLGALPFQLSDVEDIDLLGAEILPALRG